MGPQVLRMSRRHIGQIGWVKIGFQGLGKNQSVLTKRPPEGTAAWGTSCTCSGLIAPLTEAKQEQSWGLAGGGKGGRERTPQETSEEAEPSILLGTSSLLQTSKESKVTQTNTQGEHQKQEPHPFPSLTKN